MTKQEQFFYDNAGFSYDPKTETEEQGKERCAKQLAEAERFADVQGWEYRWEFDPEGCSGCDCGSDECDCCTGAEHETLDCLLADADGNVLESLGGICAATREYGRVVKAELALEQMQDSDFADFVPVADIPLAVSK